MMYSLSNINGVPFDVLFFCAVAVEDLGYLLGYLYALLDYCFCVLFFTRDSRRIPLWYFCQDLLCFYPPIQKDFDFSPPSASTSSPDEKIEPPVPLSFSNVHEPFNSFLNNKEEM